jgi:hypothetical protein
MVRMTGLIAWAIFFGNCVATDSVRADENQRETTASSVPKRSSQDPWSGMYRIAPISDAPPVHTELSIVRTEQGYRLSPPFAAGLFLETTPGVLSSPKAEPEKLYLAEATFADGKKIRVLRAELGTSSFLFFEQPKPKVGPDSPTLIIDQDTSKTETAQSMIGYADTQIFYRMIEQKVVVRVRIANQAEFPMTATVYVFPTDSTADGIDAWINNQHSDALFPETAEPSHTEKFPAELCKIATAKLLKRTNEPFGSYKEYEVTFEVDACDNVAGFTTESFRGTTRVFIKD